ncbi:MAG TPA: hypothetical protein VHF25_12780 [Nitriliruptorales bacterium]|nr:hypothetical protein [Nitriliruptorales bacterium]
MYELRGGTGSVRFGAERVEIVSVTPAPAYTVHAIDQRGPLEIEVELRSDDDGRSRLGAWWGDGPQERIEERAG